MKVLLTLFLFSVMLLTTTSCQRATAVFQENADDWSIEGDATWEFVNNELVGSVTDGAGFVMTKETFKDFELELEFNPSDSINSGVFVRCKNYVLSAADCFEINIWDARPDPEYRTGSIVSKSPPLVHIESTGRWNSYKIRCEKDHVQVWLNGELTADITDESLTEGYIGLQAAGTGSIGFRNVRITSL